VVIGLSGGLALLCGAGDWRYHRANPGTVGPNEHRAHLKGLLAGGIPLLAAMTAATVVADNGWLAVPVALAVMLTTTLVCVDELVFHRRRRPTATETRLHAGLVGGNALALLTWVHACFA
jgi:hypothetical protein